MCYFFSFLFLLSLNRFSQGTYSDAGSTCKLHRETKLASTLPATQCVSLKTKKNKHIWRRTVCFSHFCGTPVSSTIILLRSCCAATSHKGAPGTRAANFSALAVRLAHSIDCKSTCDRLYEPAKNRMSYLQRDRAGPCDEDCKTNDTESTNTERTAITLTKDEIAQFSLMNSCLLRNSHSHSKI